MTSIELADVQGSIVRGYRVAVARHFMLQIVNSAAAKQFLADLVSGDPMLPQITTAAEWGTKPEVFFNLGLTATGLTALGLPTAALATFPSSFCQGATAAIIAQRVGDIGASAPDHWLGSLSDPTKTHVVLSLWAMSQMALDDAAGRLRARFPPGLVECSAHDARTLPHNKVHFGYTDNIAQPTIEGVPARKRAVPDAQPVAPTGEFLMGYPSQNQPEPGTIYSVSPAALSRNSSFGAFRILSQDVVGLEQFLETAARTTGLDAELIAAKVCGRWRNGVPLVLSPSTAQPEPPLPHDQFNNFTYVVPDNPPQDDTFGYACPIGSHIRRANPRNEQVIGGTDVGHLHRIVRRAMPYGPAYEPTHRDDRSDRGLVGWFINVSLENQFELIMQSCVNTSTFVKSVQGTSGTNPVKNISGKDVILGSNDPSASSSFTLPMASGNLSVTDFPRLVTTRGGVYGYIPSITAIRYLAALPEPD